MNLISGSIVDDSDDEAKKPLDDFGDIDNNSDSKTLPSPAKFGFGSLFKSNKSR